MPKLGLRTSDHTNRSGISIRVPPEYVDPFTRTTSDGDLTVLEIQAYRMWRHELCAWALNHSHRWLVAVGPPAKNQNRVSQCTGTHDFIIHRGVSQAADCSA